MMTTEMQGRVVYMCRAKGFKGHGEYEQVKGFEAQHLGHAITAVFDPDPVNATGFISVFAEPQEATELLTYKRGVSQITPSLLYFQQYVRTPRLPWLFLVATYMPQV